MTTKLTVIVPEELHRQARAVAALKGENISTVVREALAEYVTEALQDTEDLQFARGIMEQIKRGEVKTYSHEEVWAEIEEAEARGELPA